ncbi:MAG TPA: DUF2339 domain-containing protein [Candidatus Binatia bacterium]|jgi:uncharacterized membrane protein|nr:DUF2339 domain-containing protein [Candidatus Binatia bacterium]
MNEQDRAELARLKYRQELLEQELGLLSRQLKTLEQRLSQPAAPVLQPWQKPQEKIKQETPVPKPAPVSPPPIPPIIQAPVAARVAPQPAASVTQKVESEVKAPKTEAIAAQPPPSTHRTPPVHPPSTGSLSPSTPAQPPSFEMRLGTYWLVRIGIGMVLTGLAFIANLAYQNFGAGGKVLLLYVASGSLLGAGWWWQRQAAKESLKNYAQVLFAGGLAAFYFTTYAAHHIESLRVIQSALLDGLLLLGCAGFMVWIADHRKSEVLALFAVVLAYYTSIITRQVGLFTLYSNLVLTVTAVFFLVRNRWAVLSFASLVASYATYGFWRFLKGSEWQWPTPQEGLWTGTCFLMSYWLVFTAAVFFSRDKKFSGENRATFLTMNNGAFFTMFLLTMLQVHHGGFWKFSLIYGSVLLVLAEVARRALAAEPLAKNFYLTQGLLLVTIGIISNDRFAGVQLALILAAESVILLMMGGQRKNAVLLTGAYIAAALAVGWGMDGMRQPDPHGLWLGMTLGALMMANTLLVHRQTRGSAETGELRVLRPQVSYFAVLALAIWLVAAWDNAPREHFSLVLAGEAALLIFSIYLLEVPEVSLLAQGSLLIAQLTWIYDAFRSGPLEPWWNPVLMLSFSLGLSYWWQKQKVLELPPRDPWLELNQVPILGKNVVLLAGVHTAVRLAGGWEIFSASAVNSHQLWLPMAIGAFMLGDALAADREQQGAAARQGFPRFQIAYSTLLALVVWLAVTWHHSTHANFPLVLAAEGLLLTFSIYLLRVREISLLSQSYLLIAQLAWLVNWFAPGQSPPWWNPALLLAMTLLLSHWWQKQKVLTLSSEAGGIWQGLYALAIVGVLYFWLSPKYQPPSWLALTSLLAIGLTAYGVFTRAWFLAACGQIFLLVSGAQFAWQLHEGKPGWAFPLAPIGALVFLSLATAEWFNRKPGADARVSQPLLGIALVYRWVALVMCLVWIWDYIPARERIWVLALVGLLLFVFAGWRKNVEALLFGGVFTLSGLGLFWMPGYEAPTVFWPNLIAILALLGQQRAAKLLPDRYRLERNVHGAMILLGGLSLWVFLSRWVGDLEREGGGAYLTAGWSLLALGLFTAGIVLRERLYRWLGLGILACAIARVFIFDVWKLETLYRILSFMALGIVLLVLGFIYNKYQEKIKEWL